MWPGKEDSHSWGYMEDGQPQTYKKQNKAKQNSKLSDD